MNPSANRLAVPLRFRRRLTLAFVVVVGFTAGILALGSFFVVDHQRYEGFRTRTQSQTRVALALTRGENSAGRLNALVGVSRQRDSFETLVVADAVISSNPQITVDALPKGLKVESGVLHSRAVKINGASYYVVAGEVPGSAQQARLYLWFNEEPLIASLNELRNVLIGGWLAVTVFSFIAGRIIAIRTLAPIQMAADSARLRAEGLLHTQLPASGSDEFRAWAHYFNNVASALEGKISELSAAHERERRFTADVAHDLRTPLGAMVSATSILSEYIEEMPEGARRPAELLVHDVNRLRRLVTDLLEIGRLDSQNQSPRLEPIDVEALIRGVVMSVRRDANVEISVDGLLRVHCDRVRLERILVNLVQNALIHGGDSATIHANTTGNHFSVQVRDFGPGIPPDQLPHVFDRFHKVSPSRAGEGSGLGLAIASQHTAVLGGTLTAENCKDGGALFRLDVPVVVNIEDNQFAVP